MALGVYTNNYSIIAQNNLTTANSGLTKSIERLSSGLRINHASDDASGLAISEKLRGQIRGLSKASMNAQDAVSLLQTAEGGMEVIGDMLQRMRELAVQAGNGTYTTNDRAELQKEVTQLKDEVNRISASTEYNTKKLLTGNASALWSTNAPGDVEAIVRGAPAEGNYRINVDATGGKNYVYKTDIMSVNESREAVGYSYNTTNTGSVVKSDFSSVVGDVKGNVSATVQLDTGAATAVAASDKVLASQVGAGSAMADATVSTPGTSASGYYMIEVLNNTTTQQAQASDFKVSYISATGAATVTNLTLGGYNATLGMLDFGGTHSEISIGMGDLFSGDKLLIGHQLAAGGAANTPTISVANGITTAGVANAAGTVQSVNHAELDSDGNLNVGTLNFTMNSVSGSSKITTQVTTNTYTTVSVKDAGTTTVNKADSYLAGMGKGSVNVINGNTTAIANGGALISKTYGGTVAVGGPATMTGYYKVEVAKPGALASLTANDFTVTSYDMKTGLTTKVTPTYVPGTGVLTIDGKTVTMVGAASAGDKILISSQEGVAGAVGSANISVNGGVQVRADAGSLGEFKVHNFEINGTDVAYNGFAQLSLADNTSGTITFDKTAKIATLDTKLKNIDRFTNADGRNILDNTQTLTIFGNGKTAEITVEGNDTMREFVEKLNTALVEKLGMGTGNASVDSQLVKYVEAESNLNGNYAVEGTIVFQAGILGANSKISMIGDENMINALSVVNIQKGEDSDVTATVTDAHSGKLIGSDTVSDNVLRGVIKGIDVKFNNVKAIAALDANTGTMKFKPAEDSYFDLHVVDNRTDVQIGANQGQTMDVSIGQINTTSLEIDDAFVITMDESQKAITKFDKALEQVTSARATIGAQINRLDYTMKNLSISKQNLVSAESRIRDLDVAEESATFSRNQILVNSAVAMLAQANQLPQVALQLLK